MSRPSLPATPIPGTPTLRILSPPRTPSPLPLFSTGGPYSYTGQITRKYASRFNEINRTKNNVKDVEGAWEKEAKENGLPMDEIMKSRETQFVWEDKSLSRVDFQEPPKQDDGKAEKSAMKDVASDKRMSLEEEQFVDALTSPVEKPKDWNGRFTLNENE